MSDLVTRLRTWVHSVHAVPVSDILDSAADEIERLRNGAVGSRETVRSLLERNGECTPESDSGADRTSVASALCCNTGGQPFDSAPTTLTDAEREAVRFCVTASLPETEKLGGVAGELCRMHGATLRSLLDRLG